MAINLNPNTKENKKKAAARKVANAAEKVTKAKEKAAKQVTKAKEKAEKQASRAKKKSERQAKRAKKKAEGKDFLSKAKAWKKTMDKKQKFYKEKPVTKKAAKVDKVAKKPVTKKAAKKSDADKSWSKAVKAQKKTGGKTMNELIKARNAAKASGDKSAYAAAQNKINKAYGSKKVHKADAPKKPKTPKFTEADIARHKENLKKHREAMDKAKFTDSAAKEKPKKPTYEELSKNVTTRKKMEAGGKVESNPFGWPSTDARGKK